MPTTQQWRAFYDQWAGRDPRLASTGHLVPDADFARLGSTIRSWLQPHGDEAALDVGCASGTLTSQWAGSVGRVVGVDFSEQLVAEATRRHAGSNLEFRAADATALPFADATFDRVVCFNVLLSLPDHDCARRAIGEILRVASPSARIVLGSLPDVRCQDRFFEVLRASASWPRRWLGRARTWLRGKQPRATKILWFDLMALRAELMTAGFDVEVHDDPPFANYRHYRRTLVLQRRAEVRR